MGYRRMERKDEKIGEPKSGTGDDEKCQHGLGEPLVGGSGRTDTHTHTHKRREKSHRSCDESTDLLPFPWSQVDRRRQATTAPLPALPRQGTVRAMVHPGVPSTGVVCQSVVYSDFYYYC